MRVDYAWVENCRSARIFSQLEPGNRQPSRVEADFKAEHLCWQGMRIATRRD